MASGRLRIAGAALMLLASGATSARAQNPLPHVAPKPGIAPIGTGMLSSPNVRLVATIPDSGETGGRFSGHYFITTTSAAIPFVPGPTGGVRIYDVANPEVPVLTGVLPLPHTENEDVDVSTSRHLILVSQDNVDSSLSGGLLYVVDWSIPQAPVVVGTLAYPASVKQGSLTVGGPGHIANCIHDCARYAWVTGARNGSIFVIDLANPKAPVIAGIIPQSVNPAAAGGATKFKTGLIHDVNEDPQGNIWVTGSGGTAMLDATDPLKPVAKYSVTPADNARLNQFIHHNSIRLDATTELVTEEDWQQPNCGNGSGREQGSFQTWRIPSTSTGTLTNLDSWITEVGSYNTGTAPVIEYCSSHWFTVNSRKIVAVGWYNQGLRFLDVSNPSDIRQVGYLIGPGSMASAGLFVPGRDDLVYVPDYQRGLDIVKIERGGAAAPTIVAPLRAEWFISSPRPVTFAPDPAFGYACARRVTI